MRVLIILLLIIISSQQNSYSCSCPDKPSFRGAALASKYIFSGTVLSEETVCYLQNDTGWVIITQEEANDNVIVYYYRRLIVELLNTYKGDFESKIIFVETPIGSTACEFPFKVGNKYIVYSSGNKVDNTISTDRCSRTMDYNKLEHRRLKKR